jgi:hypothetical protein
MQREMTTVVLRITSPTLSPQDIEARLGIKPDESWKLGDRVGTFKSVQKLHGYELNSTLFPSAQLLEHYRGMIKRIAPVAQKIGEISAQGTVEMVCKLQVKALPPIAFERDDIRWLAALGARLDFDILLLVERQEPKKPGGAPGAPGTPGAGSGGSVTSF